MATERRAEATWNGSLMEGSGRIDTTSSGVLDGKELSWRSRAEKTERGRTSPEDLIAAAHASCFAMALSHGLAQAGTPADELHTTSTVTFVPGEGITRIELTVTGRVPGADEAAFEQAARTAGENCPVSKALSAVPELELTSISLQ
jgi:osmotically inducible protein OsmC